MLNSHHEDLAYRYVFEALSEREREELLASLPSDHELADLVQSHSDVSEELAWAVPQVEPPDFIRENLMDQIDSGFQSVSASPEKDRPPSNILRVSFWLPYAAAAGLMICSLVEYGRVHELKDRLAGVTADLAKIRGENTLAQLQLTELRSKDQIYEQAEVLLAWNPGDHHGILYLKNLPPPPAGHDYQLWLLPAKGSPASAGVVVALTGNAEFHVDSSTLAGAELKSGSAPGFAVSVEPSGGSTSPTGPIVLLTSAGP